ncbi:MAG: FAD-binding protein [Aureispira sp.]
MNPENNVQAEMLKLIQKIKKDATPTANSATKSLKGLKEKKFITVSEEQEEELLVSTGTKLTRAQYELLQLRRNHQNDFTAVMNQYLATNSADVIESNEELDMKRSLKAKGRNKQDGTSGKWENDLGNICLKAKKLYHAPYTIDFLIGIVKEAKKEKCKVRFVGSGHSYSSILEIFHNDKDQCYLLASEKKGFGENGESIFVDTTTPSTLIKGNLDLLQKGVDSNYLVELKSWAPMHQINKTLTKKNLGLATMGAYDVQTIAGVLSTSTHGSRHDMGSTTAMVRSILIIARDGELLRIEPSVGNGAITNKEAYEAQANIEGVPQVNVIQNDQYFKSVLVNMGCMGLLYSVVLAVEDKYYLREERVMSTLQKEIKQLTRKDKLTTYLSWDKTIDYNLLVNPYPQENGDYKCIRTRRKIHPKEKLSKQETSHRNWLVGLASGCKIIGDVAKDILVGFHRWRPVRGNLNTALSALKSHKPYVDVSNKVFITPRPKGIKGMALELIVPAHKLDIAIHNVLQTINNLKTEKCKNKNHRKLLTGPISIRFVGKTEAYLSPFSAYGEEAGADKDTDLFACIEIDALEGTPCYDEIFHRIQKNALNNKDIGPTLRIHWGLNFGQLVEDNYKLEERYPDFDKWLIIYNELNKSRLFSNPFTKKMGLDTKGNPAPKDDLLA